MTTLGERLGEARGRESREAAADKLNVHVNTLYKYEKNKRTPDADFLRSAAQVYSVNLNWLMNDDGLMRSSAAREDARDFLFNELPKPSSRDVLVPRLGKARNTDHTKGAKSDLISQHMTFDRDTLLRLGIDPANARVLDHVGDIMTPTIDDGDPILIDLGDTDLSDNIFVIRRGDTFLVRRLQRLSDGTVVLHPDNSVYAEERLSKIEAGELTIVGRVKLVQKRL